MPAWAADQPEAQDGWLTSASAAATPNKGGLPPVATATSPSSPSSEAEATSSAAVWESDGLMGPATIPVDDSDPLPSMRPSDAHNRKMLMIAVGLLLLVVASLGFMLTRPAAKPVAVATTDVMQPSELMDKARGLAEKKNYKGASLEAEAAATMLQASLDQDPTNSELKKQWIQAEELLASMYLKSEQYDRAYKTYKELHNATGVKRYAGSAQEAEKLRLKAIRAEGQQKLDLAKQMLKQNNPAGAIMEGLHAEQLFTDGKATNAQKAAACYTLGRAFEAQQQDERAEEYYKKAMTLAYSGEYAAALARVRSRTAPVVVSAPQVQEVEVVNSVPTGPRNVRRVVRRPAPARPVVAQPPPPPRRPVVAPPPVTRRPPKSSGPPKFSSDNDPSKFKYY